MSHIIIILNKSHNPLSTIPHMNVHAVDVT